MDLLVYLHKVYFPNRINLRSRYKSETALIVTRFSAWLGRAAQVDDLTVDLIREYLIFLADQGRSPATIRSRRGALLTIWRDAWQTGHSRTDPRVTTVPMPRKLKRKPRAWSLDDVQRMLAQAANVRPRRNFFFGPEHWITLILLIYHTGLRIMAVLMLRRSDLTGRVLLVPAELQKDREDYLVPLPEDLVARLRALPRSQETRHGRYLPDYLIPWPWSPLHPTRQFWSYILKPAGLPDDPKLKFHAIRRTTASIISAKHGIEAARDVMGHSSVETTRGYIVDPELIDPALVTRPNPIHSLPSLGETG